MASTSSLSQDVARHLFEEGATLIFLDVPQGTEFGIDLESWHVGPKFKGIKMIPPGIHFVFYSAVSKEGQSAPRTGFFYNFRSKEVLIKKWDKYYEDIKDEEITDDIVDSMRKDLKSLDSCLGPYPYDNWKKWISMTNCISVPLFERLQPLNKKISSASHLILDTEKIENTNEDAEPSSTTSSRARVKVDPEAEFLPKMRHQPETEIRFTNFPDQVYPEGSSAAEITRHSLDLSYKLTLMLTNFENSDELLGELQFSFVCFLVGQVFDAFEKWKELLHLLCSCDDLLAENPSMFSKLIFILHHQLREIPRDFFVDIVSRNNFLVTTLHTFFINLESNPNVDADLVSKGKRFRKHLTKTFRWDFITEPDEYAPTIVDP